VFVAPGTTPEAATRGSTSTSGDAGHIPHVEVADQFFANFLPFLAT
jgi:hypothetical protein